MTDPPTSTYSVESADSVMPLRQRGSKPSDSVKQTQTPHLSSDIFGPTPPTSEMCAISTDLRMNIKNASAAGSHSVIDTMSTSPIVPASGAASGTTKWDRLMLLRGACRASLHQLSAKCAELSTQDGSGPKPLEWFAELDQTTGCLKTRQASLNLTEEGPGTLLSLDFPRSGMIVSGKLYPQQPLVLAISESVSSCLLPTPTARDWKDTPGMAKMATNPDGTQRKRCDMLARRIFAQLPSTPPSSTRLNPLFGLWLMGYPQGWLKPLYDALETPSSRKLSKSMRERSIEHCAPESTTPSSSSS